MGLKRKANGALLRHDDGTLMSDCCCSPPITDCTVSACLLSANAFPYELISKIKCDTLTQLGTLQTRGNNDGLLVFRQLGWQTYYDVGTRFYRGEPAVQLSWGDTNYRIAYLGWWWFGSRHLMEPGTYQIEYLGGISNITSRDDPTISQYSLSMAMATYANWDGLSEVKYAVVAMPCLTGIVPSFYDFNGTTDTIFSTQLEAETYFKAQTNVSFTLTTPHYIGIVYYIKSYGSSIDAFDKTYRTSNYNPTSSPPTESSSIEPYYPKFKLYKMNGATKGAGCNPCNPVKVTSPAFSATLGTFTWNNPTGCYDEHVIYLKRQIGTCDTIDCNAVDPATTPDYTFTKLGSENCSDIAPIANSLTVTGIDTGTYCARIDVKKTHYTYDASTGLTSSQEYTTKGKPFCFELDCGTFATPAITNVTPSDGTLITLPNNSIFSFNYANTNRIVFRLNGYQVEEVTTALSDVPKQHTVSMTNVTAYAKPNSARNSWQILADNVCEQVSVTGYFMADYLPSGGGGDGGSQTPVSCGGCNEQLKHDYTITISGLTGSSASANGVHIASWRGGCSWASETSQWYWGVSRTLYGGVYEWRVTVFGFGVNAPYHVFGGQEHVGSFLACSVTGTYRSGSATATVT